MGRHHQHQNPHPHHHHLKLPDHLYLSPPPQPPAPAPPTSLASSLLSVRSAVFYTSSTILFQETSTSARAVSDKIPGFKTSAAFLTTLRANLNLDSDSLPNSLPNTPDSLRPTTMASSTSSFPPPSSLANHDPDPDPEPEPSSTDPLSSVPTLTTIPAVSEDDKVDALHLIADSVAQQRQLASRAVMFSPITACLEVLLLGLIYQYFYKGSRSDYALIGTTFAGVLMSTLVTIRWLSGPYLEEAERVGTWAWLDKGREDGSGSVVGDADTILLTRFGDEAIGALTLRGVRDPDPDPDPDSATTASSSAGGTSPRKRKPALSSPTKITSTTGLIRAWTVKQRYRGKGVGTALLEDAIKICQEDGWSGPEFDREHANSKRLLPRQFNGGFEARDRRARVGLARLLEEMGVGVGGSTVGGKKGKR